MNDNPADNPADNLTGPDLFDQSLSHLRDIVNPPSQDQDSHLLARIAQVYATQANTAMLKTIAGLIANATNQPSPDLMAWDKVIPEAPLEKCLSKAWRRPACAERHTEDCPYAEPPPEPKHELLPVGTRVLVSDWARPLGSEDLKLMNPEPGRISGYDMGSTKYRWQYEFEPGHYSSHDKWAFADNRVQVHPDGPECPPPPERGR